MIQNEIWIELDQGTLVHVCYLQNRNCLRLILKSWKFFIVYFILSIAPIHVIRIYVISISLFLYISGTVNVRFLLLSSIRERLEYNYIPFLPLPPFSSSFFSFSSHFPLIPFLSLPFPPLSFHTFLFHSHFLPFPLFPFAPFPSIFFLPYPSLCRPS